MNKHKQKYMYRGMRVYVCSKKERKKERTGKYK